MSSVDDLEAWQLQAVALCTRFEQTGEDRLLREAITLFRRVAYDPGVGPDERWWPLSNLAKALTFLAERSGSVPDLRGAVDTSRAAVAATSPGHPGRAMILNDLGNVLRALAAQTPDPDGNRALLAESIQAGRDAVSAYPADHPDHATALCNLSNTLQCEWERSGELAVLAEAVHCAREALATAAEDDLFGRAYLVALSEGLRLLGAATGQAAVLREAARGYRTLQASTSRDDPERAGILNNHAFVLQELYQRTGDTADLDEAIRMMREALDTAPPGDHDQAGHLNNLGVALQLRFERTGDVESLRAAAEAGRQAVAATPMGSPSRATYLGNLAGALRLLHPVNGDLATLEEAVATVRAAADAAPPGHREHAGQLANLCGTLHYAYQQTQDGATLEVAIATGRQAADAVTPGAPTRAAILTNVAFALRDSHRRAGDPGSLAEAAHWLREAGRDEVSPIAVRVEAYRSLARLPVPDARVAASRLADVEDAIALLPRVAPATLARADREHGLGQLLSFAGDAAAIAVAAGNPVRAVELLEQARGILVADALDARGGHLARLRAVDPELADQLSAARERLNDLNGPGYPGSLDDAADLAEARREAGAAWDALVARAKQVAGPGFLRPPAIETLTASAAQGPVIYVYESTTRCDALVLTGSDTTPVLVVPLPGLTEADTTRQGDRLLRATAALADADSVEQPHAEIGEILDWAREVICDPVLAALGYVAAPGDGSDWPRVWWCPVGLLAYLPLHAAALDRVVSSYAVSARALVEARDRAHAASAAGRLAHVRTLVVSVPDPPGPTRLNGAIEECAAIADLIPDAMMLPRPTRDRVLRELPGYSHVHFSCHASADLTDPGNGQLVMYDHATAPLTVADIVGRRLHGDLAFLSACETGRTSPALSNEAVHLTGAFHLAGFRHVIGTLWVVFDAIAADVTRDFYAAITTDGTRPPAAGESALALHEAARRVRAKLPEHPGVWAAYSHTGP
jgi:hypothetical protein